MQSGCRWWRSLMDYTTGSLTRPVVAFSGWTRMWLHNTRWRGPQRLCFILRKVAPHNTLILVHSVGKESYDRRKSCTPPAHLRPKAHARHRIRTRLWLLDFFFSFMSSRKKKTNNNNRITESKYILRKSQRCTIFLIFYTWIYIYKLCIELYLISFFCCKFYITECYHSSCWEQTQPA